MIKFAQYFNLSESRLLPLNIHEFKTVVYFYCYTFIRRFMNGLADDSIGTVSDLLPELVVRDVGAASRCEFPQPHYIVTLVIGQSTHNAWPLGDGSWVTGISHLLGFPEGLFIFF